MPAMLAYVVVGSYIVVSFILLKHPTLIHKKKRLAFHCTHISHRGGAYERLENTLGAFKHAVSCGTEMLELDVVMTLDGQVVVSHDDNLKRLAGVDKSISQLAFKELPRLLGSIDVEFLDGQRCAEMSSSVDRSIPLLREIFENFPDVPINIDIKKNNDLLVEKVHDLIMEFDRRHITVWGNYSFVVTQKCFTRDPSIPIYFCAPRVIWLILLTYSGLLPFVPIRESCLEIFHPSAQENSSSFKEAALHNPAYWFFLKAVDCLLMRPFLFEHLRKRGLQVYLWVINDRRNFDRAFELGATGVMTDCPSLLSAYLAEHPHVRPPPE